MKAESIFVFDFNQLLLLYRECSMARRTRSERPLRFDERLVLHQWMLNLFEVSSFDLLTERMKDPELEGFDEDNVTRFYIAIASAYAARKKSMRYRHH